MSLTNIYTELHRRARETGEDRSADLRGGARLVVRVLNDVTTLTISRPKKPLGATEIETFKRDLAIPIEAVRFPLEEQGTRKGGDGVIWWYIAYRWREEAADTATA